MDYNNEASMSPTNGYLSSTKRDRLTQKEKDSNDKAWYKHKIQTFDTAAYHSYGFGGISETVRMKVNYDLFNNKINEEDFNYVIRPYSTDPKNGELKLPANFTNKDIVSNKIRALLGMEMRRPLDYKILAVNEEATTRKEEEHMGRIKEYVVSQIMIPIEAQAKQQAMAQLNGKEPTPEEIEQIEQEVQAAIQAATPPEVAKYMAREHQDPAEAMMSQLFEYINQFNYIKDSFNKGWKHALISAYEVYFVGERNELPVCKVINPVFFDCAKSPDTEFIEDGEWAVYEMNMSPSEVISMFSKELTEKEIDRIYSLAEGRGVDPQFTFTDSKVSNYRRNVRVFHATWKSLRKVGFLTYIDNEGIEVTKPVNEDYKFDKEAGDINLEWEWIPEVHEGYRIGFDIYKSMGPLKGQYRDINNLYNVKLPYHGTIYDNINAEPISAMDRMKTWQFYYNIIMFRIEKLMASDKGKIALINSKMIPKNLGIDMDKWLYFMDTLKIGFMDPTNEIGDVSTSSKELDLSMMADIKKYIELADYIEQKCGRAIGVTPEIEGQIANSAAVGNTEQNINMVSNILEPYFNMHERVKRNVLTSLLEISRYIYADPKKGEKLSFVLDDMSVQYLTLDSEMLSASSFGLFVSNSSKIQATKQLIQNLAQAALQNDKANFSDVIKITLSDTLQDAQELLESSERDFEKRQQEFEQFKTQQQQELAKQEEAYREKEFEREKELIILKEAERRETELQKQAMLSIGFDMNKDQDNDGIPDVLEVYKSGIDADIKMRKQTLDEQKFGHQKQLDKEKLSLDKQKIAKMVSRNK
jgi:hypothetical protein